MIEKLKTQSDTAADQSRAVSKAIQLVDTLDNEKDYWAASLEERDGEIAQSVFRGEEPSFEAVRAAEESHRSLRAIQDLQERVERQVDRLLASQDSSDRDASALGANVDYNIQPSFTSTGPMMGGAESTEGRISTASVQTSRSPGSRDVSRHGRRRQHFEPQPSSLLRQTTRDGSPVNSFAPSWNHSKDMDGGVHSYGQAPPRREDTNFSLADSRCHQQLSWGASSDQTSQRKHPFNADVFGLVMPPRIQIDEDHIPDIVTQAHRFPPLDSIDF